MPNITSFHTLGVTFRCLTLKLMGLFKASVHPDWNECEKSNRWNFWIFLDSTVLAIIFKLSQKNLLWTHFRDGHGSFHALHVLSSKFFWLSLNIIAKTVLSKNIQNFHSVLFPLIFSSGCTGVEFLCRKRITYLLCFHLKRNY